MISQPSITWQRVYDGPLHFDEGFNSVCNTDDGNFFVAGYIELTQANGFYVLKLNPYGDTIWTRIIGGRNLSQSVYAVVPVNDGGCVFTGANDTAFTIKLDASGNIVWYKTYPVSGSFQYADLYDLVKTSDGGYIACGKIYGQVACIYKIDSLGNLEWSKYYTAPFSKVFERVIEVNEGYLFCGLHVNSGDDTRSILLRTDANGNSIWQKDYGLFNNFLLPAALFNSVHGYLFFVTAYDNIELKYVNCLLKVDTNGLVLDSILIDVPAPTNKHDRLRNVHKINNNKFVLSCFRIGPLAADTVYAEAKIIDSLGNILHYKSFLGFEWSEFYCSISAVNGDAVFVGTASRYNQTDFDGFAVRTDSTLNVKPIGIENIGNSIPDRVRLYQNYPNPFNPTTIIKFDITRNSFVELRIFDVLGREVSTLVDELLYPGTYHVDWDTQNLPSGIYFAKILVENNSYTIKMLHLK